MLNRRQLGLSVVVVAGLAFARLVLVSGSDSFGQVDSGANKAREVRSSNTADGMSQVQSDTSFSCGRVDVDGLVVAVTIPRAEVANKLRLGVIVGSRGRNRILCGETGYFLDCNVTITGKNDTSVAYTTLGSFLFDPKVPNRFSQYARRTLSPGNALFWEIDLASVFEKLDPGDYALSLDADVSFYEGDSPKPVKSVNVATKRIPFTVTNEAG